MSTVSMVGDPATIIIGTDKADSIVTKERIRLTQTVDSTCGNTISIRMRKRPAPSPRADSIMERSMEAMAPLISSAAKGSCFQTKVTTTPRQSRKLRAWSGSIRPSDINVLLSIPFLARKVRISCAATTKGMNSGQR